MRFMIWIKISPFCKELDLIFGHNLLETVDIESIPSIVKKINVD